jgi:phosphatidate phosphatase PAH1
VGDKIMVGDKRIDEIEAELITLKNVYEQIFPIWNTIDRKIKQVDLRIKFLTDERSKLKNGQIELKFDENF